MEPTLTPMRASMRAFYRLLGERSPGGAVFERDGLLASIVPSCPRRSIVNAVVYDDVAALAAAREELAAAYAEAAVTAWTVWVPEADARAAALLKDAGHRLDARPRAMTLHLRAADLARRADLDWGETDDAGVLAAINEQAYGLPAGEFAAAITAFSGSQARLYVARRADGTPVACTVTLDADGDCGVYLVATLPAAQRQGLGGALLAHALLEARERGCSSSSLQASPAGYPVYARLGYRDVCAIDMWEHRAG